MAQINSQAERPRLSVVIASVNGYDYLADGLRSLEKQNGSDKAEVIVVEGSGDDTASRVTQEFPQVKVLVCSAPRTIPELRSLGIRCATADIVVTTEDHCVADEHWYAEILSAHESGYAAIGGAVENGSCRRLVDWAAYLCEYGPFMLPLSPGPTSDLAGPNVSYKRHILEEMCGDLLDQGVWENVLHSRLLQRGMQLYLQPAILVFHQKTFGFLEFLGQRFHFGRSYAATRVADAPWPTRFFYVVVSPFLPPLLLFRYISRILQKRRHIRELVRSLPLLVVFAATWSMGEFLGYAFGDGGSSLRVK